MFTMKYSSDSTKFIHVKNISQQTLNTFQKTLNILFLGPIRAIWPMMTRPGITGWPTRLTSHIESHVSNNSNFIICYQPSGNNRTPNCHPQVLCSLVGVQEGQLSMADPRRYHPGLQLGIGLDCLHTTQCHVVLPLIVGSGPQWARKENRGMTRPTDGLVWLGHFLH